MDVVEEELVIKDKVLVEVVVMVAEAPVVESNTGSKPHPSLESLSRRLLMAPLISIAGSATVGIRLTRLLLMSRRPSLRPTQLQLDLR